VLLFSDDNLHQCSCLPLTNFSPVLVFTGDKFVAGVGCLPLKNFSPVLLFTGDKLAAGDVPTATNFCLVFGIIWFLLACYNHYHQLAITC
jgi:hypothetical protein